MPHPLLIGYLVLYALLHSLLAARPVKAWARRRWGSAADRWYRLAYNIFAVGTLLPLLALLATLPDRVLYVVESPWRWLMLAGQALAGVGMVAAVMQTGSRHFLGVQQVQEEQPAAESPLITGGLYRYVRHPIYSFGMLFMWLSPAMSVNLLTVFLTWTGYMVVGAMHEEARLMHEFGAEYEAYRRRVPRFVPHLVQYKHRP